MKLSKKQKTEIDFMSFYPMVKFNPTEEEIEDYIKRTVYGLENVEKNIYIQKNRLWLAKRIMDIQIKDWKRDMTDGQLAYWEFLEDYCHPYMNKIVNTLRKSIIPHQNYNGLKECATCGWLNSKYNI